MLHRSAVLSRTGREYSKRTSSGSEATLPEPPGNRPVGPPNPGHRVAYDQARAQRYRNHHRKNLRVRLSTWRERQLVQQAFDRLPDVQTVLDLATGTGRFWPVAEANAGFTLAMDNSLAMLNVAGRGDRPALPRVAASVFQLPLRDASVDCILCMRFLHHLSHPEDRLRALAEMRRVAGRAMVVSVWTDTRWGRLTAGQQRLERQRQTTYPRGFGPRVCIPSDVLEAEYRASGLRVAGHHDFLPGRSMWRVYALQVV